MSGLIVDDLQGLRVIASSYFGGLGLFSLLSAVEISSLVVSIVGSRMV